MSDFKELEQDIPLPSAETLSDCIEYPAYSEVTPQEILSETLHIDQNIYASLNAAAIDTAHADYNVNPDNKTHRLVNTIHEKHGRMILKLASAQNLQPADQQNLIQDVYLKIVTSIDGLRDEDKIESWVKKVFYSTRNSYLRKNKKHTSFAELSELNTTKVTQRLLQTDTNLDETIVDKLYHSGVHERFVDLLNSWKNKKHRAVVYLRYAHQKSYQEIEAELGISQSACRIIVHRKHAEIADALSDFNSKAYEQAA